MLIQGYVAVRVGILKAGIFNDLGVAGVVGAVLVSRVTAQLLNPHALLIET